MRKLQGKPENKILNKTTFIRCLKDKDHPFNRLSAKLYFLDGYQFAIMAYILSNNNNWNLVKYEIEKRLDFPRQKFRDAWKSLINLGYIKVEKLWGSYNYTIYEDPDYTGATGGTCEEDITGATGGTCDDMTKDMTSTTYTKCIGGTLTTTNLNQVGAVAATEAQSLDRARKLALSKEKNFSSNEESFLKFNNEEIPNSLKNEENEPDKEETNSSTDLKKSLPDKKKEDKDNSIPSFEKEAAAESLNKKDNVIPTITEVRNYCRERNNNIKAELFIYYYEREDWKDNNGNPINWKQEISDWEKDSTANPPKPESFPDKKEDADKPDIKETAGIGYSLPYPYHRHPPVDDHTLTLARRAKKFMEEGRDYNPDLEQYFKYV